MGLPTLDQFLEWKYPTNSYVDHPGFEALYVRSSRVFVRFNGGGWMCYPVVQIPRVIATEPGRGAFTRLVEYILGLDRAIYVENVHHPRFRRKLTEMGFIVVNEPHASEFVQDMFQIDDVGARNYLLNFEGRLHEP